MAGETTYAAQETAGARVDAVLAAAVEGMLDRVLHDATDLGMVAVKVPFTPGSDTNTSHRKPAPVAAASASSETSGGGSNTAYTPVPFNLSPTRRYVKFQPTDLALITDPVTADPEDPRFPAVVADIVRLLVMSLGLTVTDAISALFTSVSTTVGVTTVALKVDDLFDGQFALNMANVELSAENPGIAVLSPRQINHTQDDLRGETGALMWQQATADMLKARGPGVRGSWNNFIFIQSDSCPLSDSSTNRNGCMMAADAFAFQLAPVTPVVKSIPAQNVLLAVEEMFVEISRDADNGMTTYFGNFWLAAALAGEQGRAVRVRSSAS